LLGKAIGFDVRTLHFLEEAKVVSVSINNLGHDIVCGHDGLPSRLWALAHFSVTSMARAVVTVVIVKRYPSRLKARCRYTPGEGFDKFFEK
jgi:hypothetical protein